MPLSLPRLLIAAVALLPFSSPAAGSDLWGGSDSAHATRFERVRAVESADSSARNLETPARRGSFVIVDGPRATSFGGHPRGGLHERVRRTADLRLHDRHARAFGDHGSHVVISGNTGGLILEQQRFGRYRSVGIDRSGCEVQPGRFRHHRGSTALDHGLRSSSFDRGFRSGFEAGAGARGIHQRHGFDRGSSIEFRFGD